MSSWPRSRRAAPQAAAVAVLAVLAAVGLVALGRWERHRWIDGEVRGMRRVEAAVGPLAQPQLGGYRVLPIFDCLVYKRGRNPFALELCFDRAGRLVEAIDRRSANHRYYSLRAEPAASPIRVDPTVVERLLAKMQESR